MIKPVPCPCKDCEWRSISCHADCDKYKLYAHYREQIRKVRHIEHEARGIVIEHAVKQKSNRRRKG